MKKKYNICSIIFRELNDLRKYKSWIIYPLLLILGVCGGLIPFISIVLSRVVIDDLVLGTTSNNIIKTIIVICASGLFCEIVNVFLNNELNLMFLDLRINQFDIVNRKYLSIDYYHIEDSSFRDEFEVATMALNGDPMGYQRVLSLIGESLPLICSLIIYCVVVGMFNYLVLLGLIISGVLIVFTNRVVSKYIASKRKERGHYIRQENYFTGVAYDFSYGKDIRVFSLKDKLLHHLSDRQDKLFDITKTIADKRFLYGLLEVLCLLLADGICYYFVIKEYIDGVISLGEVTMYISLITAFSLALRKLADNITSLIKEEKYVESYYEFMDKIDDYYTSGTRKAFDPNEDIEIEFQNVSFKYPHTDKWILKDFNFTIHKKEKLAIVGINGAGKSTIVKLISGLFYPDQGKILLNGIDIREFDKEELNKMFSVVYQDVNVYAASVIENIVGNGASDQEKELGKKALKSVHLDEKISSLPLQYDTPLLKILDDEGVELSGGQNQKLAIARALYKNGNVVILDEPTSALDALAEQDIYQSFNELVKNKTSIYISHRLSSTRFCDKIAMFSQDGLIEYGSHEELMALKKEYYHMFMVQGKYYQEGEKVYEQN